MTRWRTGLVALAITAAAAGHAAGQDPLAAARELYAAAAYEDALQMLDRLRAAEPGQAEERAIEQYRAFCLIALGREAEAQSAIEAVIAASPSFRPATADVSPRVRTAFSEVRRRMLPEIIQGLYTDAKTAFDAKNFVGAAHLFERVLEILKDPDVAAAAQVPPLSDLRLLAVGFAELSQATTAPPPPAPAEPPPPPPPATIYTAADLDVVPPVAIRQELPNYPMRGNLPRPGVLEVVINESGAVEAAVMRTPIADDYDRTVLGAAAMWRYQPATRNGVAVKYRKAVQIVIRR